jgi:HD-like signal output (HDOD) protein/CheY-like chemotaxis protein
MMRLLFVDDEPRVLQGLKQSLRGKREVWEVVLAGGGAAALEEIERERFDAVISDMRMPGIDGAELLRRVKLSQPHALRIMLSGQMDESAAVRAAATAHRFLTKPCDSETLVAMLSQALNLRAQLKSPKIYECIGGMSGLPSLPKSCFALNRVLEDEKVALCDVARIVEHDVGMSAKMLQLVNSAFFGLSRRIANVDEAVRNLGLNAIRSLVLAQALFQELSGGEVALFRAEEARSLLAAQFAHRFALELPAHDVGVTAAMLHNVGRLALIARLPAEQRANADFARTHDSTAEEGERARLGVTHAEIGAYLLGLWGLPAEVIEAVSSHHSPLETRSTLDPGAVVHIAEVLSGEALGLGQHGTTTLSEEALRRLGAADTVAAIRAEFPGIPHMLFGGE